MTIGVHIVTGPRNSYGPFCSSKPSVVVAVNEGGALGEAKSKSGGHTYTVFRDTTIYLETPMEWNQTSDMVGLARQYYPRLKAKWNQNSADFYAITNEQGGGEGPDVEINLKKLVAYEREIMRLANADGIKVCVLNLAGGSPGSFDIWKRVCAPFIKDAFASGNAYGRHAYGGGDLVLISGERMNSYDYYLRGIGDLAERRTERDGDADIGVLVYTGPTTVIAGNPSRPLEEADYLYQNGIIGPVIVTEAGIDGGMGYGGDFRFIQQLATYSDILGSHPLILGVAAWTLGNWQGANCQTALPGMTTYNINNPSPRWTPPSAPIDTGIENGSFENGWLTLPPLPNTLKNQQPNDWELTLINPGQTAWDMRNQKLNTPLVADSWPECVHKLAYPNGLPPDESPGGADPLILDGSAVYKMFNSSGIFAAELSQEINQTVGRRYQIPIRVHYHGPVNQDSPDTAQVHILVNNTKVLVLNAIPDLPDRKWIYPEIDIPAGVSTLKIRVASVWKMGVDFFLDHIHPISVAPDPDPEPCRGKPREQYRRTYALLAPDLDQEWAEQDIKGSWNEKRITVGGSADDAGLGDLDKRTVLAVNPGGWPGDLEAFYDEYYPGINYIPLNAYSPYQLRQYLQFYDPQAAVPPVLPQFKATHWPTDYKVINQHYGANPCAYCKYDLDSHEGVDIKAPTGSNVYAIAPGTVYLIVPNPGQNENYGKQVRISHQNGFWSVYAHLESISVGVGQSVSGGQLIGKADNTGNSFGSHLHLGLGHDDPRMWTGNLRYIDPMPYLQHLLVPTPDPEPPYVYRGRPVTFTPSLHSPGADYGWHDPALQSMLNTLKMPMKFITGGINASFFPIFNKPSFHLARVFWKPDKKKTPQQAWDEDIRDGVVAMYAAGARNFELLNEINLPEEGAGLVWANGTEAGNWLLGLANIIKINCPHSKLYFPGLSPGDPWTNQFVWTNPAWTILKNVCSGFCLHAYTGTANNETQAAAEIIEQVRQTQIYLNLQVPLVVSEASVNRAAPPNYKARVYQRIETQLAAIPGIESVCWYISSWPGAPADQETNQESWLKYGIGTAYANL